jgi:hypothetical protein
MLFVLILIALLAFTAGFYLGIHYETKQNNKSGW